MIYEVYFSIFREEKQAFAARAEKKSPRLATARRSVCFFYAETSSKYAITPETIACAISL